METPKDDPTEKTEIKPISTRSKKSENGPPKKVNFGETPNFLPPVTNDKRKIDSLSFRKKSFFFFFNV